MQRRLGTLKKVEGSGKERLLSKATVKEVNRVKASSCCIITTLQLTLLVDRVIGFAGFHVGRDHFLVPYHR